MKNDNDKKVEAFEVGDFRREPVPSSEALQASILESVRTLPQHVPSHVPLSSTPRNWFSWYRPSIHSSALVAIALVIAIGLFAVDFSDNQRPLDTFSENDLEWQELMLIEDDLLFAQL